MPPVPGLRSPYAKVGRLVFVGRMFDKIRLHAAGALPADYVSNLGDSNPLFGDARCCRFLGVRYADIRERALATNHDLDVLAWTETTGTRHTDEECEVWNSFMMKLGWRDAAAVRLRRRAADWGIADRPIETLFDLFDFDEGRDPIARRAWELRDPLAVIVIGVAGSGKTTIGQKLASALSWPFRDADEFHPSENIAKMSSGIPLTDADRAPWLAAIRTYVEKHLARGESVVVTCSALRENYRRALVSDPTLVKFVYLAGDYDLILQRLKQRHGHFMKPEMLKSQFETLEVPRDALTLDIAHSPEALVAEIKASLSL
jgi:carbohydrate kinase (thermoresistant glucokinase family)